MQPEETELSISIATQEWALRSLPPSPSVNALLETLAERVVTNHQDLWLQDFLHSPLSPKGNELLLKSIRRNYAGDADHALTSASSAEKSFASRRNYAGVLRARFEELYALRRLSRADLCLRNEPLLPILQSHRYRWLEAQTAMELSSCFVMKGRMDRSMVLADQALTTSRRAHYGNLVLRSVALRGNLDLHDGQSRALWEQDTSALTLFWGAPFPNERAFQLYHDLQQDSESAGYVYAALLLQRETLDAIAGLGRFDFEAMAHFRLAATAGRLGNRSDEKHELDAYKSLLNQLPDGSEAKLLYTAYCDIGLARLAMHSGDFTEADTYLSTAKLAVSKRDNSSLELEYLSTAAELARTRSDLAAEQRLLESIIAIGIQQADHLSAPSDRWHWYKLQDRTRRRLLEITLAQPHRPIQALLKWHSWQGQNASLESLIAQADVPQKTLHPYRTLIVLVPLETSVVAWTVDSNAVHETLLPIRNARLSHEVRAFYDLCSDPSAEIEKVNEAGSRLYEMLIAPLEGELGHGKRLAISADSILGLVPWAALRTPNGNYWIEERGLSIQTGLPTGKARLHRPERIRKMLISTPGAVVGEHVLYLPVVQAEEEARDVGKAFPPSLRLPPGQNSASRILRELSTVDGFHFAGHAITRAESGELITEPNGKAPFLTAAAIRQARLEHLQLVVLSACTTASADNLAEQNPDGLVKAFMLSGVPTVVASRWDIDSASTALLMKGFYVHLKEREDPDEALRLAIEELLGSNNFQHPYYWSAFQVFSAN